MRRVVPFQIQPLHQALGPGQEERHRRPPEQVHQRPGRRLQSSGQGPGREQGAFQGL